MRRIVYMVFFAVICLVSVIFVVSHNSGNDVSEIGIGGNIAQDKSADSYSEKRNGEVTISTYDESNGNDEVHALLQRIMKASARDGNVEIDHAPRYGDDGFVGTIRALLHERGVSVDAEVFDAIVRSAKEDAKRFDALRYAYAYGEISFALFYEASRESMRRADDEHRKILTQEQYQALMDDDNVTQDDEVSPHDIIIATAFPALRSSKQSLSKEDVHNVVDSTTLNDLLTMYDDYLRSVMRVQIQVDEGVINDDSAVQLLDEYANIWYDYAHSALTEQQWQFLFGDDIVLEEVVDDDDIVEN